MEDKDEFGHLLDIYNRYPMEELIVHPRLQSDYYKNVPDLDTFSLAVRDGKSPLCYNGDICSAGNMKLLADRFPSIDRIMAGRGVLMDPALGRELKGGSAAEKEELRRFHNLVYAGYCEEMSGDRTILYKMKELWSYLSPVFSDSRKYANKEV